MTERPTEIAEPQAGEVPAVPSYAVLAKEAEEAIRAAFPYQGHLRVRYLWSTNGISKFRANWFCEVEGRMTAVKSLFLSIRKTPDGLVVQDETVRR